MDDLKKENDSFNKIIELQNLIIKESSLRRLCNNIFNYLQILKKEMKFFQMLKKNVRNYIIQNQK